MCLKSKMIRVVRPLFQRHQIPPNWEPRFPVFTLAASVFFAILLDVAIPSDLAVPLRYTERYDFAKKNKLYRTGMARAASAVCCFGVGGGSDARRTASGGVRAAGRRATRSGDGGATVGGAAMAAAVTAAGGGLRTAAGIV